MVKTGVRVHTDRPATKVRKIAHVEKHRSSDRGGEGNDVNHKFFNALNQELINSYDRLNLVSIQLEGFISQLAPGFSKKKDASDDPGAVFSEEFSLNKIVLLHKIINDKINDIHEMAKWLSDNLI